MSVRASPVGKQFLLVFKSCFWHTAILHGCADARCTGCPQLCGRHGGAPVHKAHSCSSPLTGELERQAQHSQPVFAEQHCCCNSVDCPVCVHSTAVAIQTTKLLLDCPGCGLSCFPLCALQISQLQSPPNTSQRTSVAAPVTSRRFLVRMLGLETPQSRAAAGHLLRLCALLPQARPRSPCLEPPIGARAPRARHLLAHR